MKRVRLIELDNALLPQDCKELRNKEKTKKDNVNEERFLVRFARHFDPRQRLGKG